MDEFNNVVAKNDQLPKNIYGSITIKNDIAVSEVKSVSEVSAAAVEEAGSTHTASTAKAASGTSAATAQSISAAVSQVTATASVVTVVAAVAVVAVTTASVAAPLSQVTSANLKYYNYGGEVCIEFVLEDEGNELESFYAWIEDNSGNEITCEITAGEGAYLAEATLLEETSGKISFVVYANSNDGWSGELYRSTFVIPAAPDIGVEYLVDYFAESCELIVTCELYDDNGILSNYAIQLLDSSGEEVESVVDYSAGTISTIIEDTQAELTLSITATSNDGWVGEIYSEVIAIPTQPETGVEAPYIYYADSGELLINLEVYDYYDNLSGYIVQLSDGAGNEVNYVYDEAEGTLTVTITNETELTLSITATSNDGWTGEIYSEVIAIPTQPETGVEAPYIYYADSGELVIYLEVYDHYDNLSGYTVQLSDGAGSEVNYVYDEAEGTLTVSITNEAELTLSITATSNDGWTGEIYSEAITIPTAPGIEELSYLYYADSSELVFTLYGYSSLSSFSAQVLDSGGNEVANTVDYDAGTITVAITDETELTLSITATSNDGWTGEIYSSLITIPTAPGIEELSYLYYADSNEFVFTLYGYSSLSSFSAQVLDSGGNEVANTVDYDAGTITVAITDETEISLYITGTGDYWTGEIYSEAITIPTAPGIGVETYYIYYADSNEFVLTLDGYSSYSSISAQVLDSGGNELTSTIDYTAGTITVAITDESEITISVTGLCYYWTGTILSETYSIPVEPDVAVGNITAEIAYSAGSGGAADLYFSYEGDTSEIYSYEYWFEDEDGTKYSCTYDDSESIIIVSATFAESDSPAFDSYGRLYFVVSVLTYDDWQGEIYREKITVSDEYLTYPEITSVSVSDDGPIILAFNAYDPDEIWSEFDVEIWDDMGVIFTFESSNSVEIVTDVDGYGNTTYYVYIYDITVNSSWVVVYITASWTDGTADSLVFDDYVTVTV